jgi:hypothetical protein
MAPTRFYAIQHTFGPEIRDPQGWYIGFAYRFITQAARDAFVQRDQSGKRWTAARS